MSALAADTVTWEQSQRRWAVPAAAIAGILPLIGAMIVTIGFRKAPQNRIGLLLYFNDHATGLYLSSVFLVMGALGLGATLFFLFRAAKARETGEERRRLPRFIPLMVGIGVVLYALTGSLVSATSPPLGIVAQAITSSRAGTFSTHAGQTWQQASDLFKLSALDFVTAGQVLCSILLVASVVLISLAAMRQGLLTKWMGYVGVFVGILTLLPLSLFALPVIQAFWLIALAVLFSGRWPNGLPEAWTTGEAHPWPTMQQLREQADAERGGKQKPEPAKPEPQVPVAPGAARRKRKRKR